MKCLYFLVKTPAEFAFLKKWGKAWCNLVFKVCLLEVDVVLFFDSIIQIYYRWFKFEIIITRKYFHLTDLITMIKKI